MAANTLNDIFFEVMNNHSTPFMMERQGRDWRTVSQSEFAGGVMGIAKALQDLRVAQGDRVAILSENRREWTATDFACFLLGAIVVPVYPTLTEEQTAYILQHSRARVAFVSTAKQFRKVQAIRQQTSLEQVFVMDAVADSGAQSMPPPAHARNEEIEKRARAVRASDLATLVYTSGTTGEPKGVMLTHGNMASNVNHSLNGFDIQAGDISLSFLPLSHITARHVDLTMLYHGVTLAYVNSPERLPEAFQQIRPTVFVGVPRVFEKVYTQVEMKAGKGLSRWVYRWARRTGRKHRAEILAGKWPSSFGWKLANRLFYSKVQKAMGGRARIYISGGAPFGRDLAEWFADIGIRIYEGYGLTETSPVIAVNNLEGHRLGTVGKPLGNIDVRIAEDGEILVKGPSIFQGYWNDPQQTESVFDQGWFKTGDIGGIDSDGFLSVTDRKKDLIKTSGGKYVAPQPLETALKHNPMVAEAVVFGDRRKFPSVLIYPNFTVLEVWAREQGIAFSTPRDIVSNARVQALYGGMVSELNRRLAAFEKLRQVLLTGEELSIAQGTLTASMKVRRRQVQERIDQLLAAGNLLVVHGQAEGGPADGLTAPRA